MVIGITGSIASGKTKVANYLKSLGYKVLSADEENTKVLHDPDVALEIKNKVSADVVVNGKVDKKLLGELVFNNPEALEKLTSITHPLIYFNLKAQIPSEGLTFIEVPLLIETNFIELVDKIMVIAIDLKTQIKRLRKRNQISEEEAKKLISLQMSSEEKAKYGNYVIDNSRCFYYTKKQIKKVLKEIGG
ncbi:MAG TPA: dephospho-CoA kinase [Acholeplasma sp.]|jgi:dephospho-CoA kinase|nr:dephospho-CoA kinase [Acholeplasma sp.]